jgi:hypothetical protein
MRRNAAVRNWVRTTTSLVLLAIATTGTFTAHGAHGAQPYTGDTGRPAELINRPTCEADAALAGWYGCRQNEWPQARKQLMHRPRP